MNRTDINLRVNDRVALRLGGKPDTAGLAGSVWDCPLRRKTYPADIARDTRRGVIRRCRAIGSLACSVVVKSGQMICVMLGSSFHEGGSGVPGNVFGG